MWFRREETEWWEIGSWVGTVGGKKYWMPWTRETRKADIPLRYKSEREAILAVRHQTGRVISLRDPRLMTPDSPRVVRQHTRVDAENCPEYAHTIEAIAAELDDDPGF